MIIELSRYAETHEATLGIIRLNDKLMGFSLEDQYQAHKVMNETRIPVGVYPIKLRPVNEGKVNERYAAQFPGIHKGMLWLQDVPEFEWIYIHMGNTDDHTSGCILIAEQARIDGKGQLTTPNSAPAYERLYRAVVGHAERGELQIAVGV